MSKDFKPEHSKSGTYQVICPYCGYEPDETYPEPGGDYEEEECGRCEKKFYANAEITYSSKRDCKLNELVCDWKPDESMNFMTDRKYDWYKCPICLDQKAEKRNI